MPVTYMYVVTQVTIKILLLSNQLKRAFNNSILYQMVALFSFSSKELFSYLNLIYSEPPSIVNSSSTPVVLFKGDSLTLQCSARGYPQPVIRWYKNGSLVHENTSLQFSCLNDSHSGIYQCNASNIAGSDTYEVEVLVRGKALHLCR